MQEAVDISIDETVACSITGTDCDRDVVIMLVKSCQNHCFTDFSCQYHYDDCKAWFAEEEPNECDICYSDVYWRELIWRKI